MLTIVIPEAEGWNEKTEEFIHIKPQKLTLEHSLISLSKWEQKWKRPFLSNKPNDKTDEELRDYIRCMTISSNVDPAVYLFLSKDNIASIRAYITDPMTATTFGDEPEDKSNQEILTSELIYYYMFQSQIPIECEKWHLNRLITLLRICAVKNKEMNDKAKRGGNRGATPNYLSKRRKLNNERRKALHSKG